MKKLPEFIRAGSLPRLGMCDFIEEGRFPNRPQGGGYNGATIKTGLSSPLPDALLNATHPTLFMSDPSETHFFKRCRFTANFPLNCRYSPSHFWLAPEPGGFWRIGFTKFATRMLGEIVEYRVDPKQGELVSPGQIIGSVEGFKALTELFCVANGEFVEANPELELDPALVSRDPHGTGWLYRVQGEPDTTCVDVLGYCEHLTALIDELSPPDP